MKRATLELLFALCICFALLAWATDEIGWAAIAIGIMTCKLVVLLGLAHMTRRP